ncbi:hypothetical protein M0R45_036229 [Rubus argutus]|uniref:Secreted protein n=1 Tax=Rubus argutus TaxID=59490 RepID=A0AAW1VWD4_RUBAR
MAAWSLNLSTRTAVAVRWLGFGLSWLGSGRDSEERSTATASVVWAREQPAVEMRSGLIGEEGRARQWQGLGPVMLGRTGWGGLVARQRRGDGGRGVAEDITGCRQ